MKTTTWIVDEEHESLKDKVYLIAERYEKETELMWELFEQEQKAKVMLGKVRKSSKLVQHATVTERKFPRFIRVQSNNRRFQAATNIWNRSEPPIRTGVLIRRY